VSELRNAAAIVVQIAAETADVAPAAAVVAEDEAEVAPAAVAEAVSAAGTAAVATKICSLKTKVDSAAITLRHFLFDP